MRPRAPGLQLHLPLLALLLPLLPRPARAPNPTAQDVSLGVVSWGPRAPWIHSWIWRREGGRIQMSKE
jgi:hypothetical protein